MRSVLPLRGRVRRYAWGSTTAIAAFLGRPPSGGPEAELWLGAHEQESAEVLVGRTWRPLREVIEAGPEAALGPGALARFGPRLPFLLKVLGVARPLSLQAHPDAEQARRGFEREEARGVARDAPERSYRDPSDKPELLCALTRFEALRGFRRPEAIRVDLERFGLAALAPDDGDEPAVLRSLFERWFAADAQERRPLLARALAAAADASDPAAVWMRRLAEAHPEDPGVLAPLLLNPLRLEPGQATFLPAGELHCYLGGTAVELMANSDNVLRGGLTDKHVDLPELRRVLRFHADPPQLLSPEDAAPGERRYAAPTDRFALSALAPAPGAPARPQPSGGPELLLCASGAARVVPMDGAEALPLTAGASAWVPAAAGAYQVDPAAAAGRGEGGAGGATLVYRAALPAPTC